MPSSSRFSRAAHLCAAKSHRRDTPPAPQFWTAVNNEHLEDEGFAKYVTSWLPQELTDYILEDVPGTDSGPDFRYLLNGHEFMKLHAAIEHLPPKHVKRWTAYEWIHGLSTPCTGEIARGLAHAEAEKWADSSDQYAHELESRPMPLYEGIWTIYEWTGELRTYLKAMGEYNFLPVPEGRFPTPTNPVPATTEQPPPSPEPSPDRLGNLESQVSEIKDLVKKQITVEVVKEWYSVNEVADRMGYKPWTIRDACNKGRIAAEKSPDGQWRISQDELVRIQNHGLPKQADAE